MLQMCRVYSGVQARLLEKQPLAVYVHCMAHNLNLALNDSCDRVDEVKNFCYMMESFITSLRVSDGGLCCSKLHRQEEKVALKRIFTTRWSSRNYYLAHYYPSCFPILVFQSSCQS